MTHRIRMRVLRPLAVLAVTLAMIVPAFSAAPGASRQNAGAQTAGAQAAAAPEAATVKREMNDFERNLDRSLRQLFGNRPFGILQEAKASYLPGYGALVHAEL